MSIVEKLAEWNPEAELADGFEDALVAYVGENTPMFLMDDDEDE